MSLLNFYSGKTPRLVAVTLLISAAIPVTLYLVGQPQEVRKRAEEQDKPFAPYIGITSPYDGETIVQDTSISVAVLNEANVAGVEFYIDNKFESLVKSRPFTYVWNKASDTTPGPHTITVRAFDENKNVGTKTITVYKQY